MYGSTFSIEISSLFLRKTHNSMFQLRAQKKVCKKFIAAIPTLLTTKNAFRLLQHIHTKACFENDDEGKKNWAEFHCTYITSYFFYSICIYTRFVSMREGKSHESHRCKINIAMANFHLTTSREKKRRRRWWWWRRFFRHLIEFMMCYAWNCLRISHVTFFFLSLFWFLVAFFFSFLFALTKKATHDNLLQLCCSCVANHRCRCVKNIAVEKTAFVWAIFIS